jgi:hypothetical protein
MAVDERGMTSRQLEAVRGAGRGDPPFAIYPEIVVGMVCGMSRPDSLLRGASWWGNRRYMIDRPCRR